MKNNVLAVVMASVGIMSSGLYAEERVNPFEEEFIIPEHGVIQCDTVETLKNEYPKWNEKKNWHPRRGEGEIKPHPSQIVSYCGKWTRHDTGGHEGSGGYCSWRNANGPAHRSKDDPNGVQSFYDYDIDGDGAIDEGEIVRSYTWSMTNPMGVPQWPFSGTFPERESYKLYGGATCYLTFADKKKVLGKMGRGGGFAELGINPDHSNTWFDPRAEDHPLNIMPNAKDPKSWMQGYYVLSWKKEDFLNLNDINNTVTFDDDSVISSQPARGYWLGWDDTRFIVQDGQQWYISDGKQAKKYMPKGPGFGRRKDKSILQGFICQISPNEATWSNFYPEGYEIHLDHETAKYEKHEFKDVQAIGWYLAKDSKTKGQQAHCKWYGLSAKAVINRPEQGSVHIDMKEINTPETDSFYMSTSEVPYALYKKIHKWGNAPFYHLDARYVYRAHADMGSMTYLPEGKIQEHSQDEPVTNIGWYDALAFCNTISEYEGKTPAYYLDPECNTVFRGDHIATKVKNPGWGKLCKESPKWWEVVLPKIYIKWSADGHRLPTVSEWEAARGQGVEDSDNEKNQQSEGTVAVGLGAANENGMYDMDGNVWELVWTHGDVYDPADSAVTVLGGGFRNASNPAESSLSKYGDTPWDGNGDIGIRLVRRKAGLQNPKLSNPKPITKSWTFEKEERTKAIAQAGKKENALDLIKIPEGVIKRYGNNKEAKVNSFYAARYETTYAKWQKVVEWGEAHGYEFNKNGDMGSMYYYGYPHKTDEPVTQITWVDMIVWCNALSEMEGRTPLFYMDEAKTKVKRKAELYRPIKMSTKEMFDPDKKPQMEQYMGMKNDAPHSWYFIKWDADGYRLPTFAEFEYMFNGGTDTCISTDPDYSWTALNSGGRTHSVGTKKANEFGLYDIVGNVNEWTLSSKTGRVYGGLRPDTLDVNNPKENITLVFGEEKIIRDPGYFCLGGSWINESVDRKKLILGQLDRNRYVYYPDFGFRVIRCEAGTHPEDGKEELKSAKQINNMKPELFNDGTKPLK